mgnify:CR=1 FL=1|jgi:hypothetical protein
MNPLFIYHLIPLITPGRPDTQQKVVTNGFLVLLLLFGNAISFAFTLAFRKYLDLSVVYITSVVGVLGIFGTIVPSLLFAAYDFTQLNEPITQEL